MAIPLSNSVGSSSVVAPSDIAGRLQPGKNEGDPFKQAMTSFMSDVNDSQSAADEALQNLVTGEADNVHDVVISMAKADLAFRMVLEIRNRLTESYQEIMRMQV